MVDLFFAFIEKVESSLIFFKKTSCFYIQSRKNLYVSYNFIIQ